MSHSGVAARCLGFDMDHTLVRYRQLPFAILVHDCVRDYLLEHQHYPAIMSRWSFDVEHYSKGIIFDRKLGNFIKLDANKRVVSARHGANWLSAAEITAQYQHEAFSDFNGTRTVRLLPFITAFELPVCSLIAQLVDCIDREFTHQTDLDSSEWPCVPHGPHSPDEYFYAPRDVELYNQGGLTAAYERMITLIFSSFNYLFGDFHRGDYFAKLCKDPDTYLYRRPELRTWLTQIRSSATPTIVFMVTNSLIEYTKVLMEHAFGEDWADLFDITVVSSQKPDFFTKQTAFRGVDFERGVLMDNIELPALCSGLVVGQGNAAALHQRLIQHAQHLSIIDNDQLDVVYFGDHLVSDVQATETLSPWHAGAIVEEMHHEEHAPHPSLHDTVHVIPRFTPSDAIASSEVPLYQPIEYAHRWGSFFADGEIPTYWGEYIKSHAIVCTACVTDLGMFRS